MRLLALLSLLLFAPPAVAQEIVCNGNTYSVEANLEGLNYADPETGFFAMMVDCATEARGGWVGTSGTGLTLGLGSQVLALDSCLGFAVGQPIRIASTADPTDFMDGLSTAFDGTTCGLTVNVDAYDGSGTFAAWTVSVMRSETEAASSPLAIADGGTAGSTEAAARANLAIQHFLSVLGILSTPPGGPSSSDAYLAGKSPTGAWSGHEGKRCVWSGSWTCTEPAEGTAIYDAGANNLYVATGSVEPAVESPPWSGAKFKELSPSRQRWTVGALKDSNYSITDADNGIWWPISSDSPVTVTLASPLSSTVDGIEWVAEVVGLEAGTVTFLISGGGDFRLADGTTAASIVVPGSTYRLLHFVAGQSGLTATENQWYVWR